MRKHVWIWLLVILSYLLTYATPLFASYFMFAKPADESFGGAVFYMTIAAVAVAFMVKLYSILHKMKISYAKIILSLLFTTVLAMSSKAFFEVVGNNFESMVDFVLIWYAGYFVGLIPKFYAIKIDKAYLIETNILG